MSSQRSLNSRGPSARTASNAASMVQLSSVLYESRAIAPLSDTHLQQLIHSSQARNRQEGITGLLVYDQGRFLQWLEGPPEGVGRVWQSILHDRRHTDIALLGKSTTPVRFFGGSALTLRRRRGEALLRTGLIDVLSTTPVKAQVSAQVRADRQSLQALVDDVIVPELLARHAVLPLALPVADPRAIELAQLLLTADPRQAFAMVDKLRAEGRTITQLCAGLFEPAARALGDLWQSDDCSELDVTLGLGQMQVALRRASAERSAVDTPVQPLSVPCAVLVAPSPREPHLLGSVIASEMFWRAGWDVSCEFPDTDAALSQVVHERWFDVLDLSLSPAFTREHSLPAMAASIRAAREGSLNPALVVTVDGRIFHDRPQASTEVGADAGSASALDLVSAATRRSPPG